MAKGFLGLFARKSITFNGISPEKLGDKTFYPLFGIGQNRTIRDTATIAGQRSAYQFCPVVTSVVTKKVSAASNGQFYFTNTNGETVTGAEVSNINKLLSNFDFAMAYTMNQVFGKAYIRKNYSTGFEKEGVNGITSLEVLIGWNITDDSTKDYIQYKQENSGLTEKINRTDLIIWDDKYHNFNGGTESVKGGSRLIPLKEPVSSIAAIFEGENMVWTNGGAVGMVSPMTDKMGTVPLTPKQQDEVNAHFRNTYGLQHGKSPVLVSQNPLRWQSTILPVDQLGYSEGLFDNTRQICDCYGISPLLLGFSQGTTFANKAEAEKALYQDTVIPEIDAFCSILSSDKDLRLKYSVKCDYSHVTAMQEDESKKADYDSKVMNNAKTMKDIAIYTDQEIRQYIFDNSKLQIPK